MATRKQHYVTFHSPGTCFNESSSHPIESWDTKLAMTMAKTITECYGAKPYAFSFSTNIVSDPIDDG
jgi:hypothetical protein